MAGAVQVEGLREFVRLNRKLTLLTPLELNRRLRTAAKIVSVDARARLSGLTPTAGRSITGIRPRVRGAGLAVVEQSRRRVTGKRPDWGAIQMRHAFLPALDAKRGEVEEEIEGMLDTFQRLWG